MRVISTAFPHKCPKEAPPTTGPWHASIQPRTPTHLNTTSYSYNTYSYNTTSYSTPPHLMREVILNMGQKIHTYSRSPASKII
jgi:hypothetical protein